MRLPCVPIDSTQTPAAWFPCPTDRPIPTQRSSCSRKVIWSLTARSLIWSAVRIRLSGNSWRNTFALQLDNNKSNGRVDYELEAIVKNPTPFAAHGDRLAAAGRGVFGAHARTTH